MTGLSLLRGRNQTRFGGSYNWSSGQLLPYVRNLRLWFITRETKEPGEDGPFSCEGCKLTISRLVVETGVSNIRNSGLTSTHPLLQLSSSFFLTIHYIKLLPPLLADANLEVKSLIGSVSETKGGEVRSEFHVKRTIVRQVYSYL